MVVFEYFQLDLIFHDLLIFLNTFFVHLDADNAN